MKYNYAVIGAGRQGTAAAYDILKFGDAKTIVLADVNLGLAEQAAQRINNLLGQNIAKAVQINVTDHKALLEFLKPIDVVLCATPYIFIMNCTKAAIEAQASMVDLGGHTGIVLEQLKLGDEAKARNISIVPDCGMGPGLNNTLGVYTVEKLEEQGAKAREVRIWDGGLPQNPPEPWGYQCTFHINGLTNEYDHQALVLRNGRITGVDTLTEMEVLEFEGVGKLEAFVTSGGSSTVPYTFEGKLQVYENKTCRYPGHYAQFKAFKDLGLFNEDPIEFNGQQIVPREFYHHLLQPQLEAQNIVDICVMRAKGTGEKAGKDISFIVELVDRYDEATGFTAMERLTGWHAAIMCQFIARGEIPAGAYAMETAISSTRFMEEIRKRGFAITEKWEK